jgi:hypothetical protein
MGTNLCRHGQCITFQRQLQERVREIPGVKSAACTAYLPLSGTIPILRGRGFLPSDTEDAPQVVLINSSMARAWWGQQDPIG